MSQVKTRELTEQEQLSLLKRTVTFLNLYVQFLLIHTNFLYSGLDETEYEKEVEKIIDIEQPIDRDYLDVAAELEFLMLNTNLGDEVLDDQRIYNCNSEIYQKAKDHIVKLYENKSD